MSCVKNAAYTTEDGILSYLRHSIIVIELGWLKRAVHHGRLEKRRVRLASIRNDLFVKLTTSARYFPTQPKLPGRALTWCSTTPAPADSPKIVTLSGSPPNYRRVAVRFLYLHHSSVEMKHAPFRCDPGPISRLSGRQLKAKSSIPMSQVEPTSSRNPGILTETSIQISSFLDFRACQEPKDRQTVVDGD